MSLEWADDPGRRFQVTLCCKSCGAVWHTPAVTQYGATDYARPECPECGEPGDNVEDGIAREGGTVSKPRIRVYTNGLELDAVVEGTMRRKRIGSGFAFGECARDMDFEYESLAERDAEYERVEPILRAIPGVSRMERR